MATCKFLYSSGNCMQVLPVLKYSYLIFFCLTSYSMLIQVFRYLCWGLISSMRLGDWKYIQSVKSACSMLYLELKTSILPSLSREMIKGITWTQTLVSKMFEQCSCTTFMQSTISQPVSLCNLSGATVQLCNYSKNLVLM